MARNDSPFDMQIKLLMIGDSGESRVSFWIVGTCCSLTGSIVITSMTSQPKSPEWAFGLRLDLVEESKHSPMSSTKVEYASLMPFIAFIFAS